MPAGIAGPTPAPTSQPASLVIKLGRYDDLQKKNVLATSSQVPVIAKVGTAIIDTINKKPLDIRDRKALDIDSAQVASIVITSDIAATTKPTSRPASKTAVAINRRHVTTDAGDDARVGSVHAGDGTGDIARDDEIDDHQSCHDARDAACRDPARHQMGSRHRRAAGKPADDAKVDMLLSQLHPLRATKYLEPSAATTQPSATYSVTIITQGAGGEPPVTAELHIVDPGNSKPLIATYNGLTFELDRMIIDRLSGDFLKGSAPATPAGLGNEPLNSPGDAPGSPFNR